MITFPGGLTLCFHLIALLLVNVKRFVVQVFKGLIVTY